MEDDKTINAKKIDPKEIDSSKDVDDNILRLKIKVKEITKEICISTKEEPTSTGMKNLSSNSGGSDQGNIFTRPYSQFTIYNLKEQHFSSELQNNKRIRILYAGKELRDECFVKDCNLHDNAVLHAVITQQQPNSYHSSTFQNNTNDGMSSTIRQRNFGIHNRNGENQSIFGLRRNSAINNGISNNAQINSQNSSNNKIEGYIFFFLSFIVLFIISWATYMYPDNFSKTALNILGVFIGTYFVSLLHFIA